MTRKKTKLKKKNQEQEKTVTTPHPSAGPLEAHEAHPYEIKGVEGKGLGVVATREIKAGELILKEKPLVTHPDWSGLADLERVLSTLTDFEKDAYNSLYVNPSLAWLPRPLAIFKTNAIGLGASADKGGVFVEGSRFNHSCRPNCSRSWDEKQGVEWFIANRSIEEGEEICFAYGEIRNVKLERQEWLKRSLGFECSCEACSYSDERTSESDWRRFKIKQIDDSTEKLQARPLELIKEVNLALSLLEEERLALGAADLAFGAMNVCVWNGDRLNAIRWIDKTLELEAKEAGIWSTKYKGVDEFKGAPNRHPAWMLNLRMMRLPPRILAGPE